MCYLVLIDLEHLGKPAAGGKFGGFVTLKQRILISGLVSGFQILSGLCWGCIRVVWGCNRDNPDNYPGSVKATTHTNDTRTARKY